MNTPIVKIWFGLGLLFFSLTSKSQAFTASYTYDANGNRLTATVIYLTTSLKSAEVVKPDSVLMTDSANIPKDGRDKPVNDPLSNMEIKIYPNPSHGMLVLELAGVTDEQISSAGNFINVFDLEGHQVINTSSLTTYNTIDLSKTSDGIYMLKLSIAGHVKEYKIIKN